MYTIITTHGMESFIVHKFYLHKKPEEEEEQEWEGRQAGGSESGFRIHLLNRFDRFSKLVLLYVLVFLKLH